MYPGKYVVSFLLASPACATQLLELVPPAVSPHGRQYGHVVAVHATPSPTCVMGLTEVLYVSK